MTMATMLLALAAAATALPEDHPTCLAACAGLSCARFAPATCAMVERDLGCACAGCACLGRRLAVASNDTLLNETLLNSTALNASAAATQETETDDDDDGAPAAWSLTGTYVLLAVAAAVAAAAAKKRQEGPVDARAVAGCLAAVAVAVAILLGQGVLEYEYEFLFDAGAMGRFEGLVDKNIPDTVQSKFFKKEKYEGACGEGEVSDGLGIWFLVGFWPFLKNALVFGVCALVGRRGRAASLLKGLSLLGKWSLVKVTAASCLFAMVNLDIKAVPPLNVQGFFVAQPRAGILALLVGVLASRLLTSALVAFPPGAPSSKKDRAPPPIAVDGVLLVVSLAAMVVVVAGLALPFVQRKWEMTYHLGPTLPTIPMGGDEATWSALGLLAESSKAPNVANAGLAAGVAAVRPRAEIVVLIALASTARGFPRRHAIAATLA